MHQKCSFRVYVDLIELGGEVIQRIHASTFLYEGSLASMPDLLLLRAVKLVNDEKDGNMLDFSWLLSKTAETTQFPSIEDDELVLLQRAVEFCLGEVGGLVVAALIGQHNEAAALQLLSLKHL
nr:hypothetical protein CFP56_75541 [Quercus suber]